MGTMRERGVESVGGLKKEVGVIVNADLRQEKVKKCVPVCAEDDEDMLAAHQGGDKLS